MLQPTKVVTQDQGLAQALDYIFQNAFGNPITFTTIPTNASMRANTWGIFGNDLYIKFPDGTTKKVTLTAVP